MLLPTCEASHQAWGLSFPTLIGDVGLRHYVLGFQESLLGNTLDGILTSTVS